MIGKDDTMKRKCKRGAALLCAAVLLLSSLCAVAEDAASVPEAMTLDSAVAYAAEHHPQVLAARAALEQSTVAVKEADSLYHQYQGKTSYSFEMLAVKRGLYLTQAQTGKVIAEKSVEQVTESVKLGVKSAFYNYLAAGRREALLEQSLATVQQRVKQNEIRFESGTITKMDLQSSQLSQSKTQSDLDKARRNSEIALMQLKSAIGLSIDQPLTVTGALTLPAKPEILPAEAEKLALVNSMDIVRAEQQKIASDKNFEVTSHWYTKRTYKYLEAQAGAQQSAHSYDAAVENTRIGVYKAYDTMQSAYDAYALAEQTRDLKKQAYEISKTQYELGLVTPTDVEEAWSAAQSAELDCFDAQYAVITAAEQYVFSYTVGSIAGA